MVDDDVRHPVIVDTDALIAVANTGLWSRITVILRWDPPESHRNTEARTVTVPAHDSLSIGTLHGIADDA